MLKISKDSRTAAIVVGLLVAAFFAARHLVSEGRPSGPPDATYPAHEAAQHVGERARVCGTVVDGAYVPEVGGDPTFLNFERPHPEPVFTVVIWGDVRTRFEVPPETAFEGREVCVTGRIGEHEGRPQIVLDDPSQIAPPADRPR